MPEETHAHQLVVFTLGTEQYALPIEQVHEIIRYDEPRSVASRIELIALWYRRSRATKLPI